jgi:hypothetical protein
MINWRCSGQYNSMFNQKKKKKTKKKNHLDKCRGRTGIVEEHHVAKILWDNSRIRVEGRRSLS